MTTKIGTTKIGTAQFTARNAGLSARAPFWLCALDWLSDSNAAYREARKLKSIPDERLEDMGITREQADRF